MAEAVSQVGVGLWRNWPFWGNQGDPGGESFLGAEGVPATGRGTIGVSYLGWIVRIIVALPSEGTNYDNSIPQWFELNWVLACEGGSLPLAWSFCSASPGYRPLSTALAVLVFRFTTMLTSPRTRQGLR